jgi:hypothetical protein
VEIPVAKLKISGQHKTDAVPGKISMLSACKSEGVREGKEERGEKRREKESEKNRESFISLSPLLVSSLNPQCFVDVWETEVPTVRRHGKQAKEPGFLHQELHLLLLTLQHKN